MSPFQVECLLAELKHMAEQCEKYAPTARTEYTLGSEEGAACAYRMAITLIESKLNRDPSIDPWEVSA